FASSSERPTNPSMVSATASLPWLFWFASMGCRPGAEQAPATAGAHAECSLLEHRNRLQPANAPAPYQPEPHHPHPLFFRTHLRAAGPQPVCDEGGNAAENGESALPHR